VEVRWQMAAMEQQIHALQEEKAELSGTVLQLQQDMERMHEDVDDHVLDSQHAYLDVRPHHQAPERA
jgi:hypothetical protein